MDYVIKITDLLEIIYSQKQGDFANVPVIQSVTVQNIIKIAARGWTAERMNEMETVNNSINSNS